MPEARTFEELIERVRAGDQDASAELVRRYEPAIRRAVWFRLVDARLGGLLDSMDICVARSRRDFGIRPRGNPSSETSIMEGKERRMAREPRERGTMIAPARKGSLQEPRTRIV